MSGDEFAAWFRLLETPGVGRESARRLLAACGSPEAVLRASPATWRAVAGKAAADALTREPPEWATRLAAAQQWLAGSERGGDGNPSRSGEQRQVLTPGDPAYPPLLLQTADPPLLLYVQGRAAALRERSIAVVGSRRPTAQGSDNALAFARELGKRGLAIVSGLAQGVDGAAHEGALAAGATTVAVVGTGPDRVYPAGHHDLARRIVASGGAIVSEFAPGMPALPEHFPLRNRIIAGLAQGTLVVEAALRSGSLITARLASEAGREVFAIPGSIHAPQSKGCHALIQQGAKLVESAQDILDELLGGRPQLAPTLTAPAPGADASPADSPPDPLLDAMGHDPVTLDALMARTGWPVADLLARLLELELAGQAARLPGGLYQRRTAV